MDKYALIQIVMTFIAGAGIFGFLIFVTRMIHFKIKKFDTRKYQKRTLTFTDWQRRVHFLLYLLTMEWATGLYGL